MDGLVLDRDQIQAGKDALLAPDKNRLTEDQLDDLVSIFRGYLGALAPDYAVRSTFENLVDTQTSSKCAKLSACLLLWQENQFDVSGFAAVVGSRTGYYDSTDEENFRIFVYAFGLFWDVPFEITSRFQKKNSSSGSTQGEFIRKL